MRKFHFLSYPDVELHSLTSVYRAKVKGIKRGGAGRGVGYGDYGGREMGTMGGGYGKYGWGGGLCPDPAPPLRTYLFILGGGESRLFRAFI